MMKRTLMALVLAAGFAAVAEAQVQLEYTRNTSRGRFTLRFGGGHYSGYGYGGYGSFGPGLVAQVGGGTLTFGVRHRLPLTTRYPGYAASGFYYGSPGNSHSYYSGPVYPGAYSRYYYGGHGSPYRMRGQTSMEANPYPHPRAPRTPARSTRGASADLAAAKEIAEGLKYFKAARYGEALDRFRTAVLAHSESGAAQAHFALALAATGDVSNADKALRNAARHAPLAKIELLTRFLSESERKRVMKAVKKKGPEALSPAYMEFLLGRPETLRARAANDADARALMLKPE